MLRSVASYLSLFAKDEQEKNKAESIIRTMRFVDRKYFIRDERDAYYDSAQPIGAGQTISQPSTVARMLFLAGLNKKSRVLEAGSGSGWNACLASALANKGKVLSIDRIQELVRQAEENAQRFISTLGKDEKRFFKIPDFRAINLFELSGSEQARKQAGRQATKSSKGFDSIIITAGIRPEQETLIEQAAQNLLSEKGILVCPYTSGPLMLIEKTKQGLKKKYTREHYLFVPLLDMDYNPAEN